MKQTTFTYIEYAQRKKLTKREGFLDMMEAGALINGFNAEFLLTGRGYDTNALIEQAICK
jgi:hypothetical protein